MRPEVVFTPVVENMGQVGRVDPPRLCDIPQVAPGRPPAPAMMLKMSGDGHLLAIRGLDAVDSEEDALVAEGTGVAGDAL
jgi:hypothetical protein